MEPQEDGYTLLAHLEGLETRTGRTEDILVQYRTPPALGYVRVWWLELSSRRQFVQQGKLRVPQAILWSEQAAWQQQTGRRLTWFERLALEALERDFMNHIAGKIAP